jgi:ElaB/YqjD/DUF883 family membrane-anchored ribosome-binding protein
MSENDVVGGLQEGFGRLERGAGAALHDPGLEARGAANQLKGGARKAADKVQQKIDGLADRVADGVAKVGEQTRSVYDRTSVKARKVAERVEPFVHEKPYSALGLTLAAGVVIGLLLNSRGPRVIYVKPPPAS